MPTTRAELTLLRRATFPQERLMIGDSISAPCWSSQNVSTIAGLLSARHNTVTSAPNAPTGLTFLDLGGVISPDQALSRCPGNAVRAKQWASLVTREAHCV